jgi:hypothetical protein
MIRRGSYSGSLPKTDAVRHGLPLSSGNRLNRLVDVDHSMVARWRCPLGTRAERADSARDLCTHRVMKSTAWQ